MKGGNNCFESQVAKLLSQTDLLVTGVHWSTSGPGVDLLSPNRRKSLWTYYHCLKNKKENSGLRHLTGGQTSEDSWRETDRFLTSGLGGWIIFDFGIHIKTRQRQGLMKSTVLQPAGHSLALGWKTPNGDGQNSHEMRVRILRYMQSSFCRVLGKVLLDWASQIRLWLWRMSLTDVLEQSESCPPTQSSGGASGPCQMSCVEQCCYFKAQIMCQCQLCFLTRVQPPGLSQQWIPLPPAEPVPKSLLSVEVSKPAVGQELGAPICSWGCTSEPGLAQLKTALSSGTPCSSDDTSISRKSTEERAESSPVCPSESPIEGLWLPGGLAFVGQQKNTVPIHAPCPPGPACLWTAAIYGTPRTPGPSSMQL